MSRRITIEADPLSLINRVQVLNSALREAREVIEVLANPDSDKMPSDQSRSAYVKEKLADLNAALRG